MSRLLIILAVLVAATAFAEEKGYKVVRPDGTVEFTDQPQPGAVEIPLPESQGYKPAPVTPIPSTPNPATRKSEVDYRRLAITSPAPDQTFHVSEGPVQVQVQIDPPLRSGHKMVILLDGKSVGTGSSTTLSGLDRGTHTVTAEVRDTKGKLIKSSDPVAFHIMQYSKLFKKAAP